MGSSVGQRGKKAEADVRKFLEAFSRAKVDFDYERLHDARAARGAFQSQAGDFAVYAPWYHGLLEVKEVEHDYRLPMSRVSAQYGRMLKRHLAGGIVLVLVYHSTTKKWRVVPFPSVMSCKEAASMDLSGFAAHDSVGSALRSVRVAEGFPFE